MTDKIKNYLGVAVIISVLVLSFAAVNYVSSYSKSIEPSSFRSFSVQGEGKITAIPDIGEFSFGVLTEGGIDINKLQKENTEKTNKIIDFIKSKSIESKDIKTENYNISPRYKNFACPRPPAGGGGACPPPEIVGYAINQSVSVKIRDFSKIGEILSGAVTNGANSISGLSFKIDEPDEIQSKAREEAISKAKEKAKSIAKAGGFKIGRLISIEESGGPIFYGKNASMKLDGDSAGIPPSPNIEPGSQEIVVSVFLRYEIK